MPPEAMNELNKTLGILTAQIKSNGDKVDGLAAIQTKQNGDVGEIKSTLETMKTEFNLKDEQYRARLERHDENFSRDYKRINAIEKNLELDDAKEEWEKEQEAKNEKQVVKKRMTVKHWLYVAGAVLALLFGANNGIGAYKNVKSMGTPTVTAQPGR